MLLLELHQKFVVIRSKCEFRLFHKRLIKSTLMRDASRLSSAGALQQGPDTSVSIEFFVLLEICAGN